MRARQPKRQRKPIETPLRELIRLGRALGLTPEQAMDAGRVTRAIQRADPAHPGYAIEAHRQASLGRGRMTSL